MGFVGGGVRWGLRVKNPIKTRKVSLCVCSTVFSSKRRGKITAMSHTRHLVDE